MVISPNYGKQTKIKISHIRYNGIGTMVLARAVGLSGCSGDKEDDIFYGREEDTASEPVSKYVYGTVLKEGGSVVDRQTPRSTPIENNFVMYCHPTYTIKFRADHDREAYTFAVQESYQKKLEALNLAIEEGTRIRMYRKDFNWDLKGTVGRIDDWKLEVLPSE
tara:strand:+ start:4756 stop:5247 length:492 start_codon:yes stop_codon:yes gene_type:complete